MSADNFHFDISCAPIDESLHIAFLGSPSRKVSHWKDEDGKRLLLAWAKEAGLDFTPLPAPMDFVDAATFVKGWLSLADYGREPDHDGDNGKSWRIYNESWGHVAGNHYVFAAIEPEWAMYGK